MFAVIACVACGLAARSACAQQTQSPASQIVVNGSAEVLVPPARASFFIGVLTSAQSATAAVEDNARISKTVLEAIERAGLKHDEVTRTRLGVRPRWEFDDKGRRQKRSALEATNTIQIATDNLSQIGIYIDAALSAGATDASDIAFAAKDVHGNRSTRTSPPEPDQSFRPRDRPIEVPSDCDAEVAITSRKPAGQKLKFG
jgi:uncharacterized protein YggE